MVEDILNILIIIVGCIILYLNFSKSKKVKNSTTFQNQYAPTQRPKGRFCPYCGKVIENQAFEFCMGCGNKL